MKRVQLFYLEYCPHCKRAKSYLDELFQNEKYKDISIEWIEESKESAVANQYDYYYVPCFYVDGKKVKEGALSFEDVKEVLELAGE